MALPKRSSSRASTPLASLRRSTRAASAALEQLDPPTLPERGSSTPAEATRRLPTAGSVAIDQSAPPALPGIPNNDITATITSRANTPIAATRRSTRAASLALEVPEDEVVMPDIPQRLIATNTNNNQDNDGTTQPMPFEKERLFHAEVNVELTAEPITQIVTDMAAQAKLNITNAKATAMDAGVDTTNEGDFDWVKMAHRAVDEAEAKAKEAVLELLEPVARKAWIEGRTEDELEKGTPIIRGDGVDDAAKTKSRGAGDDVVEEGTIVASVEMQEESSDVASSTVEDDVAMTEADAAPVAETVVYEDPNLLLCFCQQPSYGETVYACEGANCRHEWYHESCLKRVLYKRDFPKPDQDWLCPYCGEYRVKAAMLPPKKKK